MRRLLQSESEQARQRTKGCSRELKDAESSVVKKLAMTDMRDIIARDNREISTR
jgi:hypothetical protein